MNYLKAGSSRVVYFWGVYNIIWVQKYKFIIWNHIYFDGPSGVGMLWLLFPRIKVSTRSLKILPHFKR